MPKIDQYTRQTLPNQFVTAQASPLDFGADQSGRRARDNALNELSVAVNEIQTKREESEYLRQLSEFQLQELERRQQLSEQEFEADDDISKYYLEDFDTFSESFLNGVPKSQALRAQNDLAKLKLQRGAFGIEDESRRATIRAVENYQNTYDNAVTAMALDPFNDVIAGNSQALVVNSANRIRDPSKRAQQVNAGIDNFQKTRATLMHAKDPARFKELVKEGAFKDTDVSSLLVDIDEDIEKKRKKELRLGQQVSLEQQIKNENDLYQEMQSGELGYDDMLVKINRYDIEGRVSDEWAVEARRLVNSEKEISAVTNSDLMSEIIMQIHDLNTINDIDPAEYLEGISNVNKRIMSSRADGKLTAEDEKKLRRQMDSLSQAKRAGATSELAYSFGKKYITNINTSLPPEYRGEATRRVLYRSLDMEEKGSPDGKKPTRQDYERIGVEVIQEIKDEIRSNAVKTIKEIQQPEESVADLLKRKGYTMKDVEETAEAYNKTVEQVINSIRSK